MNRRSRSFAYQIRPGSCGFAVGRVYYNEMNDMDKKIHMKIFSMIGLIMLMFVILFFGVRRQKDSISENTFKWATTKNVQYQYEFKYPEGWIEEKPVSLTGSFGPYPMLSYHLIKSKEGNVMTSDASISIAVYALEELPPLPSLIDLDEEVLARRTLNPLWKPRFDELMIGENSAIRFEIEGGTSGTEELFLQELLLVDKSFLYEVEALVNGTENIDQYKSLMNDAILSFNLF